MEQLVEAGKELRFGDVLIYQSSTNISNSTYDELLLYNYFIINFLSQS